ESPLAVSVTCRGAAPLEGVATAVTAGGAACAAGASAIAARKTAARRTARNILLAGDGDCGCEGVEGGMQHHPRVEAAGAQAYERDGDAEKQERWEALDEPVVGRKGDGRRGHRGGAAEG